MPKYERVSIKRNEFLNKAKFLWIVEYILQNWHLWQIYDEKRIRFTIMKKFNNSYKFLTERLDIWKTFLIVTGTHDTVTPYEKKLYQNLIILIIHKKKLSPALKN